MKKLILCASALMLAASAFAQSKYYEGDGGKGISIEVVQPKITGNVTDESKWFPNFAANMIHDDMEKYSAITMIDSTNIDVQMEIDDRNLNSGMFEGASDLSYKTAQNTLFINLAVTPAGYNLSVRVNQSNTSKASHNKNYSVSDMNSGLALKTATADILEQMGVKLTDQGKKELLAVETSKGTIEAQKLNAQAKLAEENGNNLVALTYLVQAKKSDAKLTRTSNALGKLSAMVASGNVGEKARNQIQLRKEFIKLLEETEKYFKEECPFYFVYNPEPKLGKVDYEKEWMQIGFKCRVFTDLSAYTLAHTIRASFEKMPDYDNWGLSDRVRDLGKVDINLYLHLCDKSGNVLAKYIDHIKRLTPYDKFASTYYSDDIIFGLNANIDTRGLTIKINKVIDESPLKYVIWDVDSYNEWATKRENHLYSSGDSSKGSYNWIEKEIKNWKPRYKSFPCLTIQESLPLSVFRKIQINNNIAIVGTEKSRYKDFYYFYEGLGFPLIDDRTGDIFLLQDIIQKSFPLIDGRTGDISPAAREVVEALYPELENAKPTIELHGDDYLRAQKYINFGLGYIVNGTPTEQSEKNTEKSRYEYFKETVINKIAYEKCTYTIFDFYGKFLDIDEGTAFTVKPEIYEEFLKYAKESYQDDDAENFAVYLMAKYNISPEKDKCIIVPTENVRFYKNDHSDIANFMRKYDGIRSYELRDLSKGQNLKPYLINHMYLLDLIGDDYVSVRGEKSIEIIFRLPKEVYDSVKEESNLPDYESVPASKIRKDLAIALSKKFPTKKIIAPPYGDFSYYDIFFRLLQKEKDLSSDSSPKIKDYFKKLDLKKDKNKLVYYFKISWMQK